MIKCSMTEHWKEETQQGELSYKNFKKKKVN